MCGIPLHDRSRLESLSESTRADGAGGREALDRTDDHPFLYPVSFRLRCSGYAPGDRGLLQQDPGAPAPWAEAATPGIGLRPRPGDPAATTSEFSAARMATAPQA